MASCTSIPARPAGMAAHSRAHRGPGARHQLRVGVRSARGHDRVVSWRHGGFAVTAALRVLMVLGMLGAFDTIYYHEFRLRLPSNPLARKELRLHAARDFSYCIVFASLA